MLVAEIEIFHSRRIAPTRRLSLGSSLLVCEPAPGTGGILLGGVVARFAPEIDPDLHPDILGLTHELEAGRQIAQPRLRHRLQDDRVGLARTLHRLRRVDNELAFDFANDEKAAPVQNVIAALYFAGRLPREQRGPVLAATRRGLAWRGPIGPTLIAHLAGLNGGSWMNADAASDPVAWACEILGIETDAVIERAQIQRSFREALRGAHPDHGAGDAEAADRIAELSEARRILLAD